jgi:uroporphyrinogen-III synthase
MRTVLVTRPEPGASKTSERLLGYGFSPLVLPLTQIVPVRVRRPSGKFDAVAATSANALRQLPDRVMQLLLDLPCFVVGDATAAIARARGFQTVTAGDGDGVSLAQTIIEECCTGARILYLAGRVRAPEFERTLRDAGIHHRTLQTYDTVSVTYTGEFLTKFFGQAAVDDCLLYSRRSAEAFLQLSTRADVAGLFKRTEVFCLSPRVADALSGCEKALIHVAAKPDEDALFALLQRVQHSVH